MKRLLLASALFASVLISFVANASPASAASTSGSRFYSAPIVTDDGDHVGNTQDGAYYWEDHGFDGYRGPTLPLNSLAGPACDQPAGGEIRICEVPRSAVNAFACHWIGNCAGNVTRFVWKNIYVTNQGSLANKKQITSAFFLIAEDLSAAERQSAFRSSMGVALGLKWGGSSSDCVTHTDASANVDTTPGIQWPATSAVGRQISTAASNPPPTNNCSGDDYTMRYMVYPGDLW